MAVAHLEDPELEVVINAAETLGRYGSPASAHALRAQFDRWHRAWEGRQDELGDSSYRRLNAMQGIVEHALLEARGRRQGRRPKSRSPGEWRTLCDEGTCRMSS